jgi:hypothetical protein
VTAARHALVIGAQRCGTTYLARTLARHPQIALAQPLRPEPKVFLDQQSCERGREWYVRTWFAGAPQDVRVLVEKSTSYLEHPSAAPRAQRMLGDFMAVVQLRDPVARAVSNWRFSTDNGLETRSLERALRSDLAGDDDTWNPAHTSVSPFAYVRRGRYADHLAAWMEACPDRVQVLTLEETTSGPAALETLYRAWGVDPTLGEHVVEVVNASGVAAPVLPPDLLADLREYYAEPDRRLEELLGRPVPWREERMSSR